MSHRELHHHHGDCQHQRGQTDHGGGDRGQNAERRVGTAGQRLRNKRVAGLPIDPEGRERQDDARPYAQDRNEPETAAYMRQHAEPAAFSHPARLPSRGRLEPWARRAQPQAATAHARGCASTLACPSRWWVARARRIIAAARSLSITVPRNPARSSTVSSVPPPQGTSRIVPSPASAAAVAMILSRRRSGSAEPQSEKIARRSVLVWITRV